MSIRNVHHLNCGTMCPLAGGLLGIGKMVCHCLLIETASDGLILVDTGFSTKDVVDPTRLPRAFRTMTRPALDPHETAHAQILARGLRPDDVRHIVITHLDLDHAGGLCDFPQATVHVHARELDAALSPQTRKERQRYVAQQWAHGPTWEPYSTDGELWRGLPAVRSLRGVSADVGLVALHGHTRGHSGIVVGSNSQDALLHAGDALFAAGSLTGAAVPWALRTFERNICMDNRQRKASLEALRELAKDPSIKILCSHDPQQLPNQIADAA